MTRDWSVVRRIPSASRVKVVGAGVASAYLALALSFGVLSLPGVTGGLFSVGGAAAGLFALELVVLFGPPLVGGAVAGYLTAGDRRTGSMSGLFAGFAAGFPLGFTLAVAFVIGTRIEPGPESVSPLGLALRLVVFPGVAGLCVGVLFGVGGLAGGWLGRGRGRGGARLDE